MVFLYVSCGQLCSQPNVTDINLPVCGVAFLGLLLTLRLNKPTGKRVSDLRASFDFVGL